MLKIAPKGHTPFLKLMAGKAQRFRRDELELPSGISLERLVAFCRVADAGSITRAAGGKASRQSLLSRQVKELEAFFQTELIERKERGIALTAEGDRLHALVREHILSLKHFREERCATPERVSLIAPAFLINWLVLPRFIRLKQLFPDVPIELSDSHGAMIQTRDNVYGVSLCLEPALAKTDADESLGTLTMALFVSRQTLPDVGNGNLVRELARTLIRRDGCHPAQARRHGGLAVAVASPRDDRAVRLQGHGVIASRRDGCHAAQASRNGCLAGAVVSPRDDRPTLGEGLGHLLRRESRSPHRLPRPLQPLRCRQKRFGGYSCPFCGSSFLGSLLGFGFGLGYLLKATGDLLENIGEAAWVIEVVVIGEEKLRRLPLDRHGPEVSLVIAAHLARGARQQPYLAPGSNGEQAVRIRLGYCRREAIEEAG